MYTLQVFHQSEPTAHATIRVERAADVLVRIPEIISEHRGCDRVVVLAGATRLFAVDCEGNRLPD